MSDYPMLISNKLHSFRNFFVQIYKEEMNKQKRPPDRAVFSLFKANVLVFQFS